ncbi:MAG: hypothetical protein U0324_45635 [Polyangiales bacterium]
MRDFDLNWQMPGLASIQVNAQTDAWHAGRVTDVLPLQGGALVVTRTGGAWMVMDSGLTTPVTDGVPFAAGLSVAQGPDGDGHVYVAGIGLFESNPDVPFGMLVWAEVNLPGGLSPDNPNASIPRVVVAPRRRALVIATDVGVWWAPIPARPSAGKPYAWQQAVGLPSGRWFGAALSERSINTFTTETIVVGERDGAGIWYGGWAAGQLTFKQSTVTGMGATSLQMVSLDSCAGARRTVWALAFNAAGNVLGALRSTDGGASFAKTGVAVGNAPSHTPPWAIDDPALLGSAQNGRYANGVRAHPTDPQTAAFGALHSMVTRDAGATWRGLGRTWTGPDDWHADHEAMHDDAQVVAFDPRAPGRVWIASDGGLIRSDDDGRTFTSRSASLANLEFLNPTGSFEWAGTVSASPTVPELVGGGLQDNGNVYGRLDPDHGGVWKRLDGGDGKFFVFVASGTALRYNNGSGQVMRADWDAASGELRGATVVPVVGGGAAPVNPVVSAYRRAHVEANGAQPATTWLAVVASGADVYRYAETAGASSLKLLATLPLINGDWVSGAASFDGAVVVAGTRDQRVFHIDTATGRVTEGSHDIPAGAGVASVHRVVATSQGYLAIASRWSPDPTRGSLLRSADGKRWSVAPSPTREYFCTLAARDDGAVIFLGGHHDLWASRDAGATWREAHAGLPRRFYVADVCWGRDAGGRDVVYLATTGRNVYRAPFYDAARQPGWRWCHRCSGFFFSGVYLEAGVCPAAPGGAHSAQRDGAVVSGAYHPLFHSPAAPGQTGWRWCKRCHGMFFARATRSGRCPAGDTHDASDSAPYTLAVDDARAQGQEGWWWCAACEGLFFGPGDTAGACPAGGAHRNTGALGTSGRYKIPQG